MKLMIFLVVMASPFFLPAIIDTELFFNDPGAAIVRSLFDAFWVLIGFIGGWEAQEAVSLK